MPTHRPLQREELPDTFYSTDAARLSAVISKVLEVHKTGRPILVETTSVSKSTKVAEAISQRIKQMRLRTTVQLLNALSFEQEAEIISKAGLPNAITVSTQMAGRGTDIVVSREALDLGGLYVIGVERQLARRWDDQISGRTGRQGEVGTSQFFIAFTDHLMKIFDNERSKRWIARLDMPDDMHIESRILTNLVKNNQVQIANNTRIGRERAHGYDNLLSPFRNTIYQIRQETLDPEYICPQCKVPSRKLHVGEPNLSCKSCQKISEIDPSKIAGTIWRKFIRQLINALVDAIIQTAKVEQQLIDRYTSDGIIPIEWDWDGLVDELNITWLTFKIEKRYFSQVIDFKNNLFPEAERNNLLKAIHKLLVDDTERRLMNDVLNSTLKKFRKRDHDALQWNLENLARELRSEFAIVINPMHIIEHPQFGPSASRRDRDKLLENTIQEAIHMKVSEQDWIYSSAGISSRLVNTFNSFLSPQHKIDIVELDKQTKHRNLKPFILERMARAYETLVQEYGKVSLFDYEGKVVRNEIDKSWQDMLVESELIIEELRGRSTQEILLQYGARLGILFQRFYGDIARNSIQKIFVENQLLNENKSGSKQVSASTLRAFGDQQCLCDSGKVFAVCCGKLLHEEVPKINSI